MISIIIPVHNKIHAVCGCIDSALEQDVEKEIIIISDGSTDGSDDAIDQYRDKVYKILTHERPYGPCFCRNIGKAHARGKYLLFCDGDCVLTPGVCNRMQSQLEVAPEYAFVYGDYERIGAFDDRPFKSFIFNPDRLMEANYISTVSLIRANIAPKWDEELGRCQDWDYWLTVWENGGIGYYLNETIFTAYYRPLDISCRGTADYKYWVMKVAQKHLPIIQKKFAGDE